MHYKFFSHKDCEFFPCHGDIPIEDFNCIFCYCPLYPYQDCGGAYELLENGVKSCEKCSFPHAGKNYDALLSRLRTLCFKA